MAEDPVGAARRASERAKLELARARDRRFGAAQAVLAGLLIGWGAIALKAGLNELVGGDTGYIVLMSATVIAAWYVGPIGGITATIAAAVFNALVFDLSATNGQPAQVEQFRELLYLVVGTGTAALVGSRRTARDRLEDALAEAATLAEAVASRDTRLEIMLGASGMGFWEWDVRTNDLAWSESIFRQYGLDPAAGTPDFATYLDLIHPDDREMFQTALAATVDETVPFALDFRIVWPDGTVHWTRGAGRVFLDESGQPLRMVGTGQDITARRRLEEERDQLLADERRAGEFRNAFIDVISHELRTPITTILGLSEILTRPGRIGHVDAGMAMLQDVRAESERLHRLVEDLLVLSRVERGGLVIDPEPLEPRRLLERIVAGEVPELPSISVETDLEPDLPIVAGEATYVEQIVRNLLGNAAKYTPAGSHVIVSARQHGGTVEVRISDDGPGIPQASLDRIFGLFYRDPDSARTVAGSGIGLFICASLVEAMGGRIWALRRPGGGSEFGFTLRALEADAADLEPVPEIDRVGAVEPAVGETSPSGG